MKSLLSLLTLLLLTWSCTYAGDEVTKVLLTACDCTDGGVDAEDAATDESADVTQDADAAPDTADAPAESAPPLALTGLAVIGDSRADEYRADDNRGGSFASTTLNWLELLKLKRNVNVGPWGTRSSPRRSGYEYNWALSGSTASSLIAAGQHTGAAVQVASGAVSHVIVDIGINDFADWNGTYAEIYDGSLSDSQVASKVTAILNNITTATDTILAAGNCRVLVANQADQGNTPGFIAQFPNASGRARVTAAINSLNSQLVSMVAARPKASLIDMASFSASMLGQIDGGDLVVMGEAISLLTNGDEPHHVLLGDAEHIGTVSGGFLANYYGAALNAAGANIAAFSDCEKLTSAGINSSQCATDAGQDAWQDAGADASDASDAAPDVDQPPTVTVTAPTQNQVINNLLSMACSASDDHGVTHVQFWVQFTAQPVLAKDDFSFPYTASANTSTAPNGAYTMWCVAFDNASPQHQTTSAIRNFTVQH